MLPSIFNDLSFRITVTFLNKILLDASNLSSLLTLTLVGFLGEEG